MNLNSVINLWTKPYRKNKLCKLRVFLYVDRVRRVRDFPSSVTLASYGNWRDIKRITFMLSSCLPFSISIGWGGNNLWNWRCLSNKDGGRVTSQVLKSPDTSTRGNSSKIVTGTVLSVGARLRVLQTVFGITLFSINRFLLTSSMS